jgi:putative ABC transport system permease protein
VNALTRGIRNAFRNNIRTFSIVLILALSIGLTLSMLVARQAVSDKIASVKSTIGNTITISPAGIRGLEGGGELLTTDQIKTVQNLPHITAVTQTLNDRLTSETSSLTSAIDAGSFGARRANDSGVQFQGPPRTESGSLSITDGNGTITRTFTPPIMVIGTDDISKASVFGANNITFTSGKTFDANSTENVAVIGKALAEKNNLSVGSTFKAYNTDIKVVGIFDTGNTFSNANLLMPIKTLQKLSNQTANITSATATVDDITNVSTATKAIQSALGTKADVVSQLDSSTAAVTPLESIQKITLLSLIGSMVAGAVIILLTMVMIVRERRREVGVLKAIGASNFKIMTQFVFEALTLTIIGAIVGIAIGMAAANPVTKALVNNSTSTNQSASNGPVTITSSSGNAASSGTTTTTNRAFRAFGVGQLSSRGINIGSISATISWTILLYGFGAAFIIAIVGSAVPSFLISKVRPAEVMRSE